MDLEWEEQNVKERWKQMALTVLRRSLVRTRTSTTPVWMGSVRVGGGVASTVGDRRSYAWIATVDGYWGLAYQGRVASMAVDRASLVFSADEDVHNPSVDGLGTSWGRGCFNGC